MKNLEWVTRSENMIHAYSSGLKCKKPGELSNNYKLKEFQVKEIIEELRLNTSKKVIAEKYGVSVSAIKGIFRGDNWKHIER